MKNKALAYFSGTGNTAWAAESLAQMLDGYEVISIPVLLEHPGALENVRDLGILFPTYAFTPAIPTAYFIQSCLPHCSKLEYLFSIATCSKTPGFGLKIVEDLCQRQNCLVSYSDFVRLPNSSPVLGDSGDVETIYAEAKPKLKAIAEAISKSSIQIPRRKFLTKIIIGIYQKAMESSNAANQDFIISEACDMCLVCAQSCPAGAIVEKDGRLVFASPCYGCYGCINRCPKQAISFKNKQTTPRTEISRAFDYAQEEADFLRKLNDADKG